MTHGGKRPGAGRKPSPDKKIPFAIRIRRDLAAFLETRECKTAFVEAALERTADFKRWKSQQ